MAKCISQKRNREVSAHCSQGGTFVEVGRIQARVGTDMQLAASQKAVKKLLRRSKATQRLRETYERLSIDGFYSSYKRASVERQMLSQEIYISATCLKQIGRAITRYTQLQALSRKGCLIFHMGSAA